MTTAPTGVFRTRADLAFRTQDGRNLVHLEPSVFTLADGTSYRVPAGSFTDGVSVPEGEGYALCAPYIEAGFRAGDLHDAGYHDDLEMFTDQCGWVLAHLDKATCDLLFLSAMRALDLPDLVCEAFYQGVHLFGQKDFDQDRENAKIRRAQ